MNPFLAYWRWCKSRKSWWAKILALGGPVLAALILISAVSGGSSNKKDQPLTVSDQAQSAGIDAPVTSVSEKPTAGPRPSPSAVPIPTVGQSVALQKDGWILTVTSVTKTFKTTFLFQDKTALGIYLVVNLTMDNTSNKSQALGGD